MSQSSYTSEDLAAVRRAIASGELSVMHNGRRVEYRSMDDLLKAETRIEGELRASAGRPRGGVRRFTFTTYRGE
ncbi:hypothetical protein EJO68_10110 [Variovorax atrisoli]|uniref:phage head-tail joining protein n=1 Tax=Variovorax atrisoli TaxID=3394203 RepID=UPI000F7E7C46|nr:hypothetical protein [Variovorax sp. 369]RTD94152.1 hypothetical protein EJO68_10110 [Variovorax sp. 369]